MKPSFEAEIYLLWQLCQSCDYDDSYITVIKDRLTLLEYAFLLYSNTSQLCEYENSKFQMQDTMHV